DLQLEGGFTSSNELLNRLQQNILWGARSNFVDIPTDCPQRDERMGWTGDIAVFGQTACFNFDMARFLDKWLADMRAEQNPGGGLPNTIPVHLYGFPATMPRMAIDWWGDACVLVPWALYQATGEKRYLSDNYEMMKKYVKACRFWAGFGVGQYRYIWHTPATFHFGDWVAPDVPKMQQWQARSKWTATASLYNTSSLTGKIARILGHADEAEKYEKLSENVAKAYVNVFTDGQGRLKEEFQTGYVLPLQFRMFADAQQKKAAENLTALVKKNDWCIGTGFPGTPYILFALADNGQEKAAYQMLMNTRCPSWLYEVKVGATTIWERWDGLDENGQCPIGDDGTDKMISYNHYASGAVGDFLYRRVAGLEPLEPGYRRFQVKPLPGGGLTQACAWTETPYGRAKAEWEIKGREMTVRVTVPVGSECELVLPGGERTTLTSGVHTRTCPAPQ
ncbi:MAG: alpha-L-rhamnosidase, partial [Clostridia bacterium]|nr:alpha-L-rhamnosidase [Clostridia bacterium]